MNEPDYEMAKTLANSALDKMNEAYAEFIRCKKDYLKIKKAFEELDHAKALTDGRLKVIPTPKKGGNRKKKGVKAEDLSSSQILSIAKTLGISLED
jgi:hypothetical protein